MLFQCHHASTHLECVQGWVDRGSGEVQLEFVANFNFSAAIPRYRAPPLVVKTLLTTEDVQGEQFQRQGQRLNAEGYTKYVTLLCFLQSC